VSAAVQIKVVNGQPVASACDWLLSKTDALRKIRADDFGPLPPLTFGQQEILRLRRERDDALEQIKKLRTAVELCWLALPTGCDHPAPNSNVVDYDDEQWLAVTNAASAAREALL
jgi:hypothetical protein